MVAHPQSQRQVFSVRGRMNQADLPGEVAKGWALLSLARRVCPESVQGHPGLCRPGRACALTRGTSRNCRDTLRKPQCAAQWAAQPHAAWDPGWYRPWAQCPEDKALFLHKAAGPVTPTWKTVTRNPQFADSSQSTAVYKTSPGPHLDRRHFELPCLGKAKKWLIHALLTTSLSPGQTHTDSHKHMCMRLEGETSEWLEALSPLEPQASPPCGRPLGES